MEKKKQEMRMVRKSQTKMLQILDGALVPGAVNQIAAQIKLTEIWNASYGLQYPVKI